MAPSDYEAARQQAAARNGTDDASCSIMVDGRPYFPTLRVETTNHESVKHVAATVLGLLSSSSSSELLSFPQACTKHLQVSIVSGGITNALFRVSGFISLRNHLQTLFNEETSNSMVRLKKDENHVLVRVFGAEGMIDRDAEATTLAALVDEAQLAVPYFGRFANGRLEQWLEGYRALQVREMAQYSQPIAIQMARLHQLPVSSSLSSEQQPQPQPQPSMWSQLDSWMEQAQSISHYTTPGDDDRAARLYNLPNISQEINWLKHDVVPENAQVALCHNDLLAANIMVQTTVTTSDTNENDVVQLIDFEYGGVNYAAFDIANHFNEFAGGTSVEENGVTDYTRFPSPAQQEAFLRTYLDASVSSAVESSCSFESLQAQVTAFVLSNHLYWGLWGVNQAAQEGTSEFDYLTYASNRFQQYYVMKKLQYPPS